MLPTNSVICWWNADLHKGQHQPALSILVANFTVMPYNINLLPVHPHACHVICILNVLTVLSVCQHLHITMNLYLYKGTQTSHAPSGIRTHNPSTCHGHGSHQYDVHHQKSDYITRRVIWLTWSNMWYDWHGQKSDMTYMVKHVIWFTWSKEWYDVHCQKSDMIDISRKGDISFI